MEKRGEKGKFSLYLGEKYNFLKRGRGKNIRIGRNLLITAIQYISIYANKVKDPGPKVFMLGSRKFCYPEPGNACRTFFNKHGSVNTFLIQK